MEGSCVETNGRSYVTSGLYFFVSLVNQKYSVPRRKAPKWEIQMRFLHPEPEMQNERRGGCLKSHTSAECDLVLERVLARVSVAVF